MKARQRGLRNGVNSYYVHLIGIPSRRLGEFWKSNSQMRMSGNFSKFMEAMTFWFQEAM